MNWSVGCTSELDLFLIKEQEMTSFTAMFCFGLSLFLMFHVMEAYDPTKGFISLPFNTSVYRIQKPYNKQENQRYSFKNGVHKLWVFANDKPHTTSSHTKPRTEIAIRVSVIFTNTSILRKYIY